MADEILTLRQALDRAMSAYQSGKLAEAENLCQLIISAKPDVFDALHLSGVIAAQTGNLRRAVELFGKAIAIDPNNALAHNNLGNALHELNRPEEAETSYRQALRLRPDFAEALNNRGNALCALGRLTDAEMSFREALRLEPDYPAAHNNLGLALLLAGRLREGWEEYEWRWKTEHMARSARNFSAPLWNGEPIGNRIILLHAEQGLGETLHFCRYAPLIAADARVILEVQAPLVRLLSRLPGVTQILARGDTLPPFDVHCPLQSLPRAFGTTLDTIPAATPYLAADPALAAGWRDRLAGLDGLRVGLVWAGGQRPDRPGWAAVNARRSIALATMAPLGGVSGVSFISLQKGEPASQAAYPPHGMTLHDFTAELHDFADTAALVDGLDLVITVCTSVAHLAGAMGKAVWILLAYNADWRWLLDRDDSPWYPTARLFRQDDTRTWDNVIARVHDELFKITENRRSQPTEQH